MNEQRGNNRWVICALIFFATTINYLDRTVISLLKSTLTKDFKWDDGDYDNIEIAFKIAYSIGLLYAGRLIDRLGTKMGSFFSTLLWCLSAIFHALVNSTTPPVKGLVYCTSDPLIVNVDRVCTIPASV